MHRKRLELPTGRGAVPERCFLHIYRIVFFISFIISITAVSNVLAVSSVNVPLDHWSYAALDKLKGFGLIHSDLHGTRPFTRMEVARLVNEALGKKKHESLELPSLAEHLLSRFEKEFGEELSAYDSGSGGEKPPSTFIKPLEELQARYVYAEGEPRQFVGYPDSRSGIDATEGTPLVYNNNGVVYREHHNFTLQFSATARVANIFSGYIQPILLFRENTGDVEDTDEVDADLLTGYAKISPWNVELEAGRDVLWWGQGYHGTLLMTNNADPLDLVKLSNPRPFLLPWLFRYLGPFKYTVFVSKLENDRVISDALLGGIRLNFKPFPIFELGIATTSMFGGDDQPSLSFSDYLDMLGFQGGNANKKFNQLAALDFRLQLPFLQNAELYGEYGGEDSGGTEFAEEVVFGDIGYLVGLYFPKIACDGRTDFRVEYAHNAHRTDSTPGFWYGHAIYRSGYTHNGLIMGHHMDGDAFDVFARVTHYLRNDLQLGLDYDYMTRGVSLSPVEERINQVGTDVTYDLNARISLMARYGFESVENFNLLEGDERENHLLMTVFKLQF